MNYFEEWYKNTLESGVSQMINVADTLLNHLNGIINATNNIAENLNSQHKRAAFRLLSLCQEASQILRIIEMQSYFFKVN